MLLQAAEALPEGPGWGARGAWRPVGRGPHGGEDEGVRVGAAGAGGGGGVRGVDAGWALAALAVCGDEGRLGAQGDPGMLTAPDCEGRLSTAKYLGFNFPQPRCNSRGPIPGFLRTEFTR
jgi:hypothetical protein